MKGSIKFLSGFAGSLGLVLALGLPSLAQANNPIPNSLQNRPVAPVDQPTPQFPGVSYYQSSEPVSIGDILSRSESFEMLNALLPLAGMTTSDLPMMLKSDGSYTVFAPTDEAFAALPEGTIKALVQPENRELLTEILRYHVVSGKLTASAIRPGTINSNAQFPVSIQADGSSVRVNDANVISPDILASNGVIHAIDRVIMPPALQTRLSAIVPASTPRYSRTLINPSNQPSSTPGLYNTTPSQYNTAPGSQMNNMQMNRQVPIPGGNTTPATQPSNIIPNTRPAIENNN